MGLNLNKYTIDAAALKVRKIAAQELGPDAMGKYQEKYKEVVEGYMNSTVDAIPHLETYQPFQEWLPLLIANKEKIMPNLICNILKKDIYAFNIYNILQKETGSTNLLIEYNQILNNPELRSVFRSLGSDQKAIGILNAVHWLSSNEAAEDVHNSTIAQSDLCAANGILGVNNNFLDCSHVE